MFSHDDKERTNPSRRSVRHLFSMALRRLLTKRSALKPVVQLDVLHKIFPIRPSEALSQSLDGSVRHLSQAATAFQQNTSFWSSFLKRTSQVRKNVQACECYER